MKTLAWAVLTSSIMITGTWMDIAKISDPEINKGIAVLFVLALGVTIVLTCAEPH